MSYTTKPRPLQAMLIILALVVLQACAETLDGSNKKDREAENGLLLDLVSRQAVELQKLQTKVSKLEHLAERVQELEKLLLSKEENGDSLKKDVGRTMDGNKSSGNDKSSDSKRNDAGSDLGQFRVLRQFPEKVAFSAVMAHPESHLAHGKTVKCSRILLNYGNGYDSSTGVFTAPSPGTYLFSYNVGHTGTGEMWFQLMKNGQMLNGVAFDGTFAHHNLEGSNTALVDLAIGDRVWVYTVEAQASVREQFTSFSGVLLLY